MEISNNALGARFNGTWRRFAITTVIAYSVLGFYMWTNHHQSSSPAAVQMPSWVPFYPAFIIPYLGMLLLTWLLPVTLRDPGLFRGCMVAYAIGYLLVMPWWVLTPTILSRPELTDNGIWRDVFGAFWNLDAPTNVLPCAHCVGPVIAVWFAAQDRPHWRAPLVLILSLGVASIALTWQHRPVDILLGVVAAAVGIAAAEKSRRTRSAAVTPV